MNTGTGSKLGVNLKKLNKQDKALVESAELALREKAIPKLMGILQELKSKELLDFDKAHPLEKTLLNTALSLRNEEASTIILDAGARFDLNDFRGATSLMKAASFSLKLTRRLIEDGADIAATDCFGQTALFHCCESPFSTTEHLTCLIEAGADVNWKSLSGRTPLHSAASFAVDPDKVRCLLEAGADASIVAKGEIGTALEALIDRAHEDAKVKQKDECIRLLS